MIRLQCVLLMSMVAGAVDVGNTGKMEGFGEGVDGDERILQEIAEAGVARVDGVAGKDEVKQLYDFVVEGLPEEGVTHHNVQLPLLLPVLNTTRKALGKVEKVFSTLMGGDSVLYELCSLVNLNGATRQRTHADFHYDIEDSSKMYSILLALQDITVEMGPTEIFLSSHTKDFHDTYCSKGCEDHLMERDGHHAKLALLKAGDMLVMHSNIVHRGGPSTYPEPRAYLWISFLSLPEVIPAGSPPTIVPWYRSKYMYSKHREWLARPAPFPSFEEARRMGGSEDVSGTPYQFADFDMPDMEM
eukprot:TRINITY_DN7915_c2_g4_i1.p1 TRINITY_DN7915_c2_g4~~TRINITY_DN7915_c2_g4_i1.p1  ORF type:complete len:301 (+),score=60.08 TRINITY_DN7915_c2_g4_i1:49-951(+)